MYKYIYIRVRIYALSQNHKNKNYSICFRDFKRWSSLVCSLIFSTENFQEYSPGKSGALLNFAVSFLYPLEEPQQTIISSIRQLVSQMVS
jgi:hypothetical protein